MVKLLGLFLMFISAYSFQEGGLYLGLIKAFFISLFMFFSDAIIDHISFVQREKVRAKYRRR